MNDDSVSSSSKSFEEQWADDFKSRHGRAPTGRELSMLL